MRSLSLFVSPFLYLNYDSDTSHVCSSFFIVFIHSLCIRCTLFFATMTDPARLKVRLVSTTTDMDFTPQPCSVALSRGTRCNRRIQ
jgi:hypothetical protein